MASLLVDRPNRERCKSACGSWWVGLAVGLAGIFWFGGLSLVFGFAAGRV